MNEVPLLALVQVLEPVQEPLDMVVVDEDLDEDLVVCEVEAAMK